MRLILILELVAILLIALGVHQVTKRNTDRWYAAHQTKIIQVQEPHAGKEVARFDLKPAIDAIDKLSALESVEGETIRFMSDCQADDFQGWEKNKCDARKRTLLRKVHQMQKGTIAVGDEDACQKRTVQDQKTLGGVPDAKR